MILVIGTLCKEDLQKLIDETDWGTPFKGKHYKQFHGEIDSVSEKYGYDCFFYWKKKGDPKNKSDKFIKFRTMLRYKDFKKQTNGDKSTVVKDCSSDENIF